MLEMSAKENVTNKASNPREESGMSGTSSAVSASNVLSANTEKEISRMPQKSFQLDRLGKSVENSKSAFFHPKN